MQDIKLIIVRKAEHDSPRPKCGHYFNVDEGPSKKRRNTADVYGVN